MLTRLGTPDWHHDLKGDLARRRLPENACCAGAACLHTVTLHRARYHSHSCRVTSGAASSSYCSTPHLLLLTVPPSRLCRFYVQACVHRKAAQGQEGTQRAFSTAWPQHSTAWPQHSVASTQYGLSTAQPHHSRAWPQPSTAWPQHSMASTQHGLSKACPQHSTAWPQHSTASAQHGLSTAEPGLSIAWPQHSRAWPQHSRTWPQHSRAWPQHSMAYAST